MKRYLYIFKQHKKGLVLYALVILLSSPAYIFAANMNATFIDTIVEDGVGYGVLIGTTILYIFASLSAVFLERYSMYLKEILINFFSFELKVSLLDRFQRVPKDVREQFDEPTLAKRIEDDAKEYTEFFITAYITPFIYGVELIVVTVLIFQISPYVGFLSLICIPFFLVLGYFFKNPIRRANFQFKQEGAKFFGMYTDQLETPGDQLQLKNQFKVFYQKIKRNFFLKYGFEYINYALALALVIGVGFLTGPRAETAGVAIVAMSYIGRNLNTVQYYTEVFANFQQVKASITRLDELSNLPVEE